MPSTVIRGFHYHSDHQALDITFLSGRRYRYSNVPVKTYEEMRASFSKGEFFNRHIRDYFDFQKLE